MIAQKKEPTPAKGTAQIGNCQRTDTINVALSLQIRNAEQDAWLLAQIVRTAPDPATITVAFDTLRERHSPFFMPEFEAAFQIALSGRAE